MPGGSLQPTSQSHAGGGAAATGANTQPWTQRVWVGMLRPLLALIEAARQKPPRTVAATVPPPVTPGECTPAPPALWRGSPPGRGGGAGAVMKERGDFHVMLTLRRMRKKLHVLRRQRIEGSPELCLRPTPWRFINQASIGPVEGLEEKP